MHFFPQVDEVAFSDLGDVKRLQLFSLSRCSSDYHVLEDVL